MNTKILTPKLHFILFPLLAQGHMIPMIDIAKLLAQRDGITVTIITTPQNAARFKPVIARANEVGLEIRFLEVPFSHEEAGLPEGCENFDTLPSKCSVAGIFVALSSLQPKIEQYLESVHPKPSCMISDQLIPCAMDIARKFGIPRIVFHGPGCFPLLCSHNITAHKVLDNVKSDFEPFVVPEMPDKVEFTEAQVSVLVDGKTLYRGDFLSGALDVEKEACGIIVNTFEELEPEYVKEYKKLKMFNVYCVGPVSLCSTEYLDKYQRGNNNASSDENECLKWLDLLQQMSVVYACMGSLNNLSPVQMMQLGLGLELSNKPFIWVIRESEDAKELKKLIFEDGLEERIKGRGFIIWGWAPQVLILSHPSIGAFLTHCGWNSILEGVSAGIPFITWPLFGDQFYNEKLVVQLLGTGVSVGAKASTMWKKTDEVLLVTKQDVAKAVEKVICQGEEGEKRREKAKELGKMANRAVEDDGSSQLNITLLIQDIMDRASRLKESASIEKEFASKSAVTDSEPML